MARPIAPHRTFMGCDIFHERHHTGLRWTARTDSGGKLRAETLADTKAAIRAGQVQ